MHQLCFQYSAHTVESLKQLCHLAYLLPNCFRYWTSPVSWCARCLYGLAPLTYLIHILHPLLACCDVWQMCFPSRHSASCSANHSCFQHLNSLLTWRLSDHSSNRAVSVFVNDVADLLDVTLRCSLSCLTFFNSIWAPNVKSFVQFDAIHRMLMSVCCTLLMLLSNFGISVFWPLPRLFANPFNCVEFLFNFTVGGCAPSPLAVAVNRESPSRVNSTLGLHFLNAVSYYSCHHWDNMLLVFARTHVGMCRFSCISIYGVTSLCRQMLTLQCFNWMYLSMTDQECYSPGGFHWYGCAFMI
jgi:hypothetical protein